MTKTHSFGEKWAIRIVNDFFRFGKILPFNLGLDNICPTSQIFFWISIINFLILPKLKDFLFGKNDSTYICYILIVRPGGKPTLYGFLGKAKYCSTLGRVPKKSPW